MSSIIQFKRNAKQSTRTEPGQAAEIIILCPPGLEFTQASIRQAAIQAGATTEQEIINIGVNAVAEIRNHYKLIRHELTADNSIRGVDD